MPGPWKAWKAKIRLPTLSTSPLEISPKAGKIPTFPPLRRRFFSPRPKNTAGGLSPPARRSAPPKWFPFTPPRWSTFTPPLTGGVDLVWSKVIFPDGVPFNVKNSGTSGTAFFNIAGAPITSDISLPFSAAFVVSH